ncbi:ABC transporter substrate-binding protein [Aquibacillus sediminis]|uniref:ABC transporter substrate-binding protein n=1 Tax=Aquibacillus sediminis TaxID=2574734 RepID=UPI001107E286|nr:ABC transporter substrate-binding protein [Aquibacillus sediminis]
MSKRKIVFLVFMLASIVMVGCSNSDNAKANNEDERDDQLVLAVGGEPDEGFDPTTGWGRYGSPLFQSTLLKRDNDLSIVEDLAKDYKVSDNGLVWTVTIRDDVQFSDGEPLTAEDVVFTFETAAKSQSVIDLTNVETIEQMDQYTVQFTLEQPQSTFVSLLVTTGIVPKHAYNDQYREQPVGSGPYQLVQWDKGQQLMVEANPYYYGDTPSFKRLTFLFLSEESALAAAQAGDVDVVSVPATYANQTIDGMDLAAVQSVDNRGIMFPYVQTGEETEEGHPIGHDVTADRAIRQAINLAIDREALVEGVLEGHGTPAYTVADGLPWWNADTVIEDADPEEATAILNEAGWFKGEQGIFEKDGLKAAFTLHYPTGDRIRQSLAMAVASQLQPFGMDIRTEGKSWSELETLMYSNPVMMGWGSHDPIEIYNLFSSETRGEGYYNANYYSNETVDHYLQQAMHATSQEEANQYWQQAQWDGETGHSAKGDAPWAWLVNLDHLYYIREGLNIGEQKVQPHGHGWPITDFITNWHWTDERED